MDFTKCKIKFLNIRGEDISDEEYFKRPGISNSRLKYINPTEGGSPQLFKTGIPFKWDGSLILGSAVHQLILQPNEYELSDYSNKPSGKLGLFIDLVYKYRSKGNKLEDSINLASKEADYYVGSLTRKRLQNVIKLGLEYYFKLVNKEFVAFKKEIIVLPSPQLYTCKKCIHSFKENFDIQKILRDGLFEKKELLNEIALFSDVQVTLEDGKSITLPIKGKFDSVVIDPETKTVYLNDIKTTSKPVEYFMPAVLDDMGEEVICDGRFSHSHYYRQLGLYYIMLSMYLDYCLYKADYKIKCNIFAIETTGENRSQLFKINNSYIQEGIKEFKELICRVAYHELYGYDKEPL